MGASLQSSAMKKLPRLARCAHSPRRKRLICLQFVYYAVQLVTDWFAVSLFFVQFRVSTDLCLSDSNRSPIFNSESTDSSLKPVGGDTSAGLHCGAAGAGDYVAVRCQAEGPRVDPHIYIQRFWLVRVRDDWFDDSVYLHGGILLSEIPSAFSLSTYFMLDSSAGSCTVILTILPYLFSLPSWVNIFQIYSMSNLHDVSWGTRPEVDEGETQTTAESLERGKNEQMKTGKDTDMEQLESHWKPILAQARRQTRC